MTGGQYRLEALASFATLGIGICGRSPGSSSDPSDELRQPKHREHRHPPEETSVDHPCDRSCAQEDQVGNAMRRQPLDFWPAILHWIRGSVWVIVHL